MTAKKKKFIFLAVVAIVLVALVIWISALPGGKEKCALYLEVPMLSPHHIESHCCPKCKKIIIDSSDYENNLD